MKTQMTRKESGTIMAVSGVIAAALIMVLVSYDTSANAGKVESQSTQNRASIEATMGGLIGVVYVHDGYMKNKKVYCGGKVVVENVGGSSEAPISNGLRDDGTLWLRCEKCGKKWKQTVAHPLN